MVLPFMTIYLTNLGFSIFQAGVVVGMFGAGAICGGYIGGKLTDKIGFYRIQLFTLTGGGCLFIVLGFMKSYPLICSFTFILSLVNEAFRPANNSAIVTYSRTENRTRSFSLNRLAINLGWALGGTLGGLIASFNYHLLFWIDGFTNIIAAVMLYYLLKPAVPLINDPAISEQIIKRKPSSWRQKVQDLHWTQHIVCDLLFSAFFYHTRLLQRSLSHVGILHRYIDGVKWFDYSSYRNGADLSP